MKKDVQKAFEAVLEGSVTGKESALETRSRRVWLQNFAAVSATGAVMWACGSKSSSNDSTAAPGCAATALDATGQAADAALLNAALDLENEAINLYTAAAGLPVWDAASSALAPTFLAIAKVFLTHHTAHAGQLTAQIKVLNGTPNAAPAAAATLAHYPGITGLTGAAGLLTVLQVAAERELNASKAYYGLAIALKSQDDVNIVANISPDEAAHYGVLAAASFAHAFLAKLTSPLDQNTIVPGGLASGFAVPTGFSPRTA